MTINETIKQKAYELSDYMVEKRRYFHVHAEETANEFETSKYLKAEVTRLGLSVVDVPDSTGFIAIFDTGKPGKTLVLRTDIDALLMTEDPENLKGPRECVSENPNAFHGCGHDAHMAMQLGNIRLLTSLKDQLKGKILFCFEEGEERGTGILQMMKALEDFPIDAVYGTHVTSFMPTGTVCVDPGPRMAGAGGLDFSVVGRGGHGSRPDLSINPIFAVAQIINSYPTAWVNQLDVTKTVTLAVTKISGGTTGNIIPDEVSVLGTLRFFDMEEGAKAHGIVTRFTNAIAEINNCTIKYGPQHKVKGGPVINDPSLSAIAQQGIKEIMPEALVHGYEWYASESFRVYGDKYPALFAFVGIGNKDVGSGAEHHNAKFDVDEASLKFGVIAASKFAFEFLNR